MGGKENVFLSENVEKEYAMIKLLKLRFKP